MRRVAAGLALLAGMAAGQTFPFTPNFLYTYDYNAANWAGTGQMGTWTTNGDGTFASASGGATILTSTVPGASASDYEIAAQMAIKSGGGTYMLFLRSTTGATPTSGSYLSVEFVVPAAFTSPGAGTLVVHQSVNGTLTQLASSSVALSDGMKVRAVVYGTTLWVWLDNCGSLTVTVPATTGQPGFGGYSIANVLGLGTGSAFNTVGAAVVKVGHRETTAPSAVAATTVASSVWPNSVALQWKGVSDDMYGIGIWRYAVSR
jgi:hypothetical protein